MMPRVTAVFVIAFFICLSAAATAAGSTAPDKDTVIGAGAHFSWVIMDAIKDDIEKHSGLKLTLYGRESMLGVGCNAGIKTAVKSTPEAMKFGMVCCPLSDEEVAKNRLKVYPLASEPILMLVNRKNPVNNLTAAQVRAIFSGKISNWKDVGGEDMPIVVVTRLHCKKRPGHWKTILPSHKEFRQERLNVQSAAEMVKRINDFPGAFGHTGSAWAFGDTDHVKAIRVDGYEATAENLRNGHYPFNRLLSIVFRDDADEKLLQIGTIAQQLIREHDVTRKYQLLPAGQ